MERYGNASPHAVWGKVFGWTDAVPCAGLDIKIMLTLGVYRLPSLNLASPCHPFEGQETWVLPCDGSGKPVCSFYLLPSWRDAVRCHSAKTVYVSDLH